jgi:D-alanyl-D-alanine carboxypeptidase
MFGTLESAFCGKRARTLRGSATVAERYEDIAPGVLRD